MLSGSMVTHYYSDRLMKVICQTHQIVVSEDVSTFLMTTLQYQ